MATGFSRRVKRPGRGIDHPPHSSAKVKKRVELWALITFLGQTLPYPQGYAAERIVKCWIELFVLLLVDNLNIQSAVQTLWYTYSKHFRHGFTEGRFHYCCSNYEYDQRDATI
jgi:hypothetical protein